MSRSILFGERPLSRALAEFSAYHHGERNQAIHPNNADAPLSVATGLEVYSSTMPAPHELFDLARNPGSYR
jgi:hypothetical protein